MNSVNIFDLPDEILMEIFKLAENEENLKLTCFKFWEIICENKFLNIDAKFLTYNSLDLDRAFETSQIELIINELDSYKLGDITKVEDKIESFLRSHGKRVTHFGSEICLENYMTKFIPFLPNLETISLFKEIPVDKSKIAKFSVKVKELVVYEEISEDCLEVFDIEKLELCNIIFTIKYREMLNNWKNLKQLKFNHSSFKIDFSKALQGTQLEKLQFTHGFIRNPIMFGNLLKSQKFLKEFQCYGITKYVWTFLCDNLKQLEVLKIDFIDDITSENFKKISSLSNLKSLTIKNEKCCKSSERILKNFTKSCFEELMNIKSFQNLEYLELQIHFELTKQHIVDLAANYLKLKALDLDSSNKKQNFDVVVTIYEQFNQLNYLKLNIILTKRTEKKDIKDFLSQSHQNLKLKKLQITVKGMDTKKLIQKIARDFPNLEKIGFLDIRFYDANDIQMILTKLKNLKVIADYTFSYKCIEILQEFGQNLEKFNVNLDAVEDPDGLLENCGLTYFSNSNINMTTIQATRGSKKDKMKWIGQSFFQYCEWKKLRTMMDSKREIKKMHIDLCKVSKFKTQNIAKSLKIIGKNVETLSLYSPNNLYDIKIICEVFPKCEILKIKTQNFHHNPKEKYLIESSKIKFIYLEFFEFFDYENHCVRMLGEFLKRTKLSALKRLYLTFSRPCMIFKEALERQTVLKGHQECLKYQPQLKNMTEKVDDINNALILAFSDE